MRRFHNNQTIYLQLKSMDPELLNAVIQERITLETLNLEVNTILGYQEECITIKKRIADIKIMSLILSGDLPPA